MSRRVTRASTAGRPPAVTSFETPDKLLHGNASRSIPGNRNNLREALEESPGLLGSHKELTIEDTAKLKIDVQLNVQIFRLRKIDNSTEEVTLDLGITFMWNDPHLIHNTKGKHNFSTHPSISRFKPMPSMKNPSLWPDDLQVIIISYPCLCYICITKLWNCIGWVWSI